MIRPTRRHALIGLAASPMLVSTPIDGATPNYDHVVDPRAFGAKCDGNADDTLAIQRAVDACLSVDPPIPLVLSGPCRISSSIIVNRKVDQSAHDFTIVGLGRGAGFSTKSDIALFDSSLPVTNDPMSAGFSFNSITFEASSPRATVASGKLLRVKFFGCSFVGIRCLDSNIYAQEWAFLSCYATRWAHEFFSSAGGYHITSTNSKYQFGGAGFRIADPTRQRAGCVGCSFIQDSFESNDGPFLTLDQARAVTIQALYSEANNTHVLDFSLNGPNRGILVSGCFFHAREINKSDQSFAEIKWGVTESGTSISNVSEARLHGNERLQATALKTIGDTIISA